MSHVIHPPIPNPRPGVRDNLPVAYRYRLSAILASVAFRCAVLVGSVAVEHSVAVLAGFHALPFSLEIFAHHSRISFALNHEFLSLPFLQKTAFGELGVRDITPPKLFTETPHSQANSFAEIKGGLVDFL